MALLASEKGGEPDSGSVELKTSDAPPQAEVDNGAPKEEKAPSGAFMVSEP